MSTRERLANLYETYLKKRPRQHRSRAIVDAILSAGVDWLARTGSEEALKVDEVAARAGVGVASVYDYFPDRQRLLVAVSAKVMEKNLLEFEELLDRVRDVPLREALTTVVDFAFAEYLRDRRVTRAWGRIAAANDLLPVLIRSQEAVAQRLASDLARRPDVRVGDPEIAAWLVTHMLMGAIQTVVWDDDGRVSPDRVRDGFIEMAYAYLTHPP